MAKINITDLSKKTVGELELSDAVFGQEVNEGLLYDVLKAQLAGKRSGSAKVKGRSEVRGTSKKVYKQKGTGGARHGNRKAPLYVGGGRAHGPHPRDYSYRPPRKMRLGALRSALSMKFKEGRLLVLDNFQLDEIKTKKITGILDALEIPKSSLIVDIDENENLKLSARNLKKHNFVPPEGVNLYDILRHEHLVVTKEAVAALEGRLA